MSYCREHDIFDCWFAHSPETPKRARIISILASRLGGDTELYAEIAGEILEVV